MHDTVTVANEEEQIRSLSPMAESAVVNAHLLDLEMIHSSVALRLLAATEQRETSPIVAVVSVHNLEAGRRSTLVVDVEWLRMAAESLESRPGLANHLRLPTRAVIAELPSEGVLFADDPNVEREWMTRSGDVLVLVDRARAH